MARYISVVETAKMLRAALKEAFPGVKFSVRSSSYSMGASINISYTDGPSAEQVRAITGNFEGSYFDGMTDYKGLNYSSVNGEEVRFGADFIFVNRIFTAPVLTSVVVEVCNFYGFDNEVTIDSGSGNYGAFIKEIGRNADSEARGFAVYDIQRIIQENVSKVSLCETQVSETAGSVAFLGDDGYGYGAVGRLAA